MSKTQEQLDEEMLASLLPTINDMFSRIFCEARVSDLPPEDDEESDDE
jgi:hypothetical protein